MAFAVIKDGAVLRASVDAAGIGVLGAGETAHEFDTLPTPGQLWDGQALSDPEPTPPPPPSVPRSVSMRQARLALLGAGLLDEVEALIALQPAAVQIEWEYATDIWRNRDLVATLAPALGLSDAQIDDLFVAAKAIP